MRAIKLPVIFRTWQEAARRIATVLNEEPTFECTLVSGTASTVISNSLVGMNSVMAFMPLTANAAVDMNSMYVSARGKQAFTVIHANNGNGDRTFAYSVSG